MKHGLTVLLFSLLILSSCGYHMAGTGSHLTAGMKSIFIPVFENKTMEPIIEEELTTAVIREFLKDGRIEVADISRADMVLKVSVVSYKETPVSFDAEQNALEYRVAVTTHLTLLNTNKLWEHDVTSTAEYTVSSDVMTTRIKKLSALREIARNLSEEVADRVLLGW
ncbi:MAG TPA: LptE family protein [Nitrospirota bacterium]